MGFTTWWEDVGRYGSIPAELRQLSFGSESSAWSVQLQPGCQAWTLVLPPGGQAMWTMWMGFSSGTWGFLAVAIAKEIEQTCCSSVKHNRIGQYSKVWETCETCTKEVTTSKLLEALVLVAPVVWLRGWRGHKATRCYLSRSCGSKGNTKTSPQNGSWTSLASGFRCLVLWIFIRLAMMPRRQASFAWTNAHNFH